MKNLLFILVVLMPFFVVGQQLEDGFYRIYHNSKWLITEGKFVDGRKEGKWRIFAHKNIENALLEDDDELANKLAPERDFLKNFLNRTPIQIITYRNGELHGPFESFYLNGRLETSAIFKEGKLEGEYQEFSEFGKYLRTGKFIEDKKHRVWKYYYPDGKLKREENYFMGIRIGEWRKYHPNGKLEEFISYVQGKPEGEYICNFDNGKVRINGFFEDGKQVGEWKEYFDNGNLASLGNFMDGLEDGVWEVYGEGGQILALGSFDSGMKNGIWTEQSDIHPEIFKIGPYQNNIKTGNWKLITKAGDELQEEIYKEGRLLTISPFRTIEGEILEAGNLNDGNGTRVNYHPTGYKISWGPVINGKPQGIWQYFHPNSGNVALVGR